MPSSNGVSPNMVTAVVSGGMRGGKGECDNRPGPNMTAFQSMMLSGSGLPEIPPGGSDDSLLKSRIRRFLQLVDYNIGIPYTNQLFLFITRLKKGSPSLLRLQNLQVSGLCV